MARPLKQGLDYYSMDCYFLEDIKIRKILRACGANSIAVLIDLLGNIYRDEGYYMRWDDDICFLIADTVGVNEASVSEIVKKAVQVHLFDQEMFKAHRILTSSGIQSRFLEAVRRRKEVTVYQEFILLKELNEYNNLKIVTETDDNGVNVNNNPVNVYSNEQSKVKESKVKKSKENSIPREGLFEHGQNQSTNENDAQKTQAAVNPLDFYQQEFGVLSPYIIEQITDHLTRFTPEMVIQAMKIARERQKRFNYAHAILESWTDRGIKTLEQVKAEQVAFKNKQYKKPVREEQLPEWAKKEKQDTVKEKDNSVTKKELENLIGGVVRKKRRIKNND
ncbi:Lin1244/Lin1753 domain-containing protein [Atopobacter phocae]|uniref:Lin1244/Lin1753 domain-containing protein n=1 Tax=Atopobacter phocae TaxID=136492 RepID=UPI000472EBB4|nr:Lin1244/Lin1753 domain-containing protein [Atopobacter phocae]